MSNQCLLRAGHLALTEDDIRPLAVPERHGQRAGFAVNQRAPGSCRFCALQHDRVLVRGRVHDLEGAARNGERISFFAKSMLADKRTGPHGPVPIAVLRTTLKRL